MGIMNYAKAGFGLGIGLTAAQMIFMLLGIIFFMLGLTELRKAKERNGSTVFPLALMVIGVVFAGGLGFGQLMDEL